MIERITSCLNDRNLRIVGFISTAALLSFTFLLWVLVMTLPSRAQDNVRRYCWYDWTNTRQCEWRADETLRETRRDNVYVPRGQRLRHTRKIYIQKPDHGNRHVYDGDKCKSPVSVVGDQYASEKGAQEEADKAWMQTARWQHGERYMARENADNATYECGRSSVGSVAGQIFHRCRLSANPCRPDKQDGQ